MSANDMLQKRSVEFGMPARGGENASWPYLVSFIPYPYKTASATQNSNFQGPSAGEAQGPDGILLPAGGRIVTIPVPLARDANYMLESIRYSAHRRRSGDNTGKGGLDYLVAPATFMQTPGESSFHTAQDFQRIPWNENVEITVYLQSAGDRDYYGGQAWTAVQRRMEEIPLPLTAIESRDSGPGELEIAAMLAKNTIVVVKARNIGSEDLYLNGTLIGFKVA